MKSIIFNNYLFNIVIMSEYSFKQLIVLLSFISKIFQISCYPIFPTILTVSIPIMEKNSNLKNVFIESRIENNYVRWLQASGADLVVVHPWTSYDEIDYLLSKVNGVLFQ